MAPPPSYAVSPTISLTVRILTIVCLAVSLVVLTTASGTAVGRYTSAQVNFKDFKAFRYLCATVVIGAVYTVVQVAFTVYRLITGNILGGDTFVHLDFYGDKLISYILVSGGAASFGMTQEVEELADSLSIGRFINTVNAATALCLLGFAFSAVSSIFSSFNLPKRPSSV